MNKKVILILFIIVFTLMLLPNVSSLTFDNRLKSYDESTKTFVIDDNFGFGGDLLKFQLMENSYICGIDCYAIWNITIYSSEDNFLGDLVFEKIEGSEGVSEYKFEVISSYEDIVYDDYGKDCKVLDEFGLCTKIKIGEHTEKVPVWSSFDPVRKLPVGNYVIKLSGKKEFHETVDWIGTFYGQRFDTFAFWAASDPTSYWNFNEVSAETEAADFLGLNNMTRLSTSEVGFLPSKLNNGINMNFTAAASAVFNTSGRAETSFGTNDFTIAYWINGSGAAGHTMAETDVSLSTGWGWGRQTGGVHQFSSNNTATMNTVINVSTNNFSRVVWVREGTGSDEFRVYVNARNTNNGTLGGDLDDATHNFTINTPSVEGQTNLDDLQIYNGFAWTLADVIFDYDGGAGIEANITTESLTVALNLPVNNTISSASSLTFQATTTPILLNMTNATLILSNATSGASLIEDFILMGTGSNISEFNITGLDLITYHWNVLTCGIRTDGVGGTNCSTAPSNFTLTIGVQEITSFFINETIEGDTNTFQINVSIPDGRQISTNNLHYNNTVNTGTRTLIAGNNFTISTTQAAPLVDAQTNISFFWNITLDNGVEFNSNLNNQSVISLSIDDCTSFGVLILNYTLKDEDTQTTTVPDGGLTNSTMQIDVTVNSVGTNDSIITFSQNYTNTNPAQVCLNQINDSSYDMDVVVRYEFTDHVVEFNNIQEFRLQNSSIPQNIDLLDLLTTNSQEFLITFKDKNLLPVQGALIDVSRQYISEGVFKSVEIPLTDPDAQVVAHLVLSDEIYTFTVTKDGVILGVFENLVAFCENQATGDCKIDLTVASPGFNTNNFITTGNLNLQTTYDSDTMIITTIFTTVDGSVATVQLNGTLNDALGNTTICSDSLTSSSGTLTCTVPNSFGNSSVLSQVYNSGVLVGQNSYSTALNPAQLFGGTRIVLSIIMFTTVSLMALTNAPATLILSFIALIIIGSFNLLIAGSYVGQGSTILWFAAAVLILFYKMRRREAV